MKFVERINSLLSKIKSQPVETIIISEKQCPHCTSRGMLIFGNNSELKPKNGEQNGKSN
ncbi:MAG: hypothetical protein ABI638_10970 [Ignavibacteriota bacterium]